MKLTYISPICQVVDVELDVQIAANSPIPPITDQEVGANPPGDGITGPIGSATGDNGGSGWVGLSKRNSFFSDDED